MNTQWFDAFKWTWRARAWLTIFGPLVGSIAAVAWVCRYGIHAITIAATIIMYIATMFGLTVGYHRLLTHHSFECSRTFRMLLTSLGCMAAQGPPLFWVAIHRLHHQHSDREGDPHSPVGTQSRWSACKALVHAHIGWMLEPIDLPNYARLLPDLLRDRAVTLTGRWYLAWAACGVLAPGLVVGGATGTYMGLAEGMLFGGLLRICLVHHFIWSVNSIGHCFGSRPYATKDASGNLALLAIPTLGEAWHNNHHAFPYSAREGLLWWQLDLNYIALLILSRCGVVWNLKLPASELHRQGPEATP